MTDENHYFAIDTAAYKHLSIQSGEQWEYVYPRLVYNIYKIDDQIFDGNVSINNQFDFNAADDLTNKLSKLLLEGWRLQSEERKLSFYKWISKNSWVEDYSKFIVIREEFNMLPWSEWPQEFKMKN